MTDTKKRLLIYPYDFQAAPIVRYRELINDYEISNLVSPKGWCVAGKDAGAMDMTPPVNMEIENDFDTALNSCDAVLFSDTVGVGDFNKMIKPKLIQAAKAGKDILCQAMLDEALANQIKAECEQNSREFRHLGEKDKNGEKYRSIAESIDDDLKEIMTPVIFVLGLLEKTGKFDLQLAIRKELTKIGYKVGQVGTRNNCDLFGFHSFPKFMFSTDLTESEKIRLFNRYIKEIEVKEQPEVIVIGVPGGVMPYSKTLTANFGVTAFEISHAVKPDAVIMALHDGEYQTDTFDSLSKMCIYRYGYEIDCFHMTNTQVNHNDSDERARMIWEQISWESVCERKNNFAEQIKQPIYSLFDSEEPQKIATFLIDQLAGNEIPSQNEQ